MRRGAASVPCLAKAVRPSPVLSPPRRGCAARVGRPHLRHAPSSYLRSELLLPELLPLLYEASCVVRPPPRRRQPTRRCVLSLAWEPLAGALHIRDTASSPTSVTLGDCAPRAMLFMPPHVSIVCFSCYRRYRGMFLSNHTVVAKADRGYCTYCICCNLFESHVPICMF